MLAINQDLSLIRLEQANDVFEQDAFAPSAFTDNCRNVTFKDGKIEPIKDSSGAKPFGHFF